MLFKVISACLVGLLAAGDVIIANNKNFDDIIYNNNKASLVEFYASWCSHCKKLEPKWEELASRYEKTSNVQIVKIECEENRITCNQFDIGGFPTIKLFDGNKENEPIEFEGKRNVDSFVRFINNNVDDYVYIPKIQSNVVQVGDLDFDKLLESGKNVFTVFTASWCGHCNRLKPEWEELANVFAGDDNVVIAQISTTDVPSDELKKRFKIGGFPTILGFKSKDTETPINYQSGRDLGSLVNWVNEVSGTSRSSDGSLLPSFGRIKEIDEQIVELFEQEPSVMNELASDIIAKIRDQTDENSKYYKKLLNKIVNGEEAFFEMEIARLNRLLLSASSLSKDKIDSLQRRLNILSVFKK